MLHRVLKGLLGACTRERGSRLQGSGDLGVAFFFCAFGSFCHSWCSVFRVRRGRGGARLVRADESPAAGEKYGSLELKSQGFRM